MGGGGNDDCSGLNGSHVFVRFGLHSLDKFKDEDGCVLFRFGLRCRWFTSCVIGLKFSWAACRDFGGHRLTEQDRWSLELTQHLKSTFSCCMLFVIARKYSYPFCTDPFPNIRLHCGKATHPANHRLICNDLAGLLEQVNLRATSTLYSYSDSALCWPKAAKSLGISCHQVGTTVSHQNNEFTDLITEVRELPKKLNGVAGTQQID